MPGTIQVSVFDLMGLPSSSSSVKVSMGSREHQIWDKGVFSFPLTTLREDLIVTLFNIEGVELSRTGVNTKLVVEKGVWDDLFPLEGGGHLHMKLQFILSKEDRNRIREMRETALKKKREELLLSSKRSETEAVSKVANDITNAFNHEVTDSQGNIVQREAASDVKRVNSESNPEDRKNVRLQYSTPNKTDGGAESSKEHRSLIVVKPFKEHEVHLTATQRFVDNIDRKIPPNGVPARPLSSKSSVGYATTPSKNEIDAAEETSSELIPSQEHPLHVTEATQSIPLTIDTRSPPNDITTRHSSSSTLSTIQQIAPEETPRNNVIDGERTASPTNLLEEIKAFHQRETTRQVMEKTDIQSPPDVIPNRFISSKEYLRSSKFLLGRKSYSTSNLLEESRTSINENQTAKKKTPSNVRNMISVFENSLTQEPQSRASALKLTPNLSKVATEVPLKEPTIDETAMRIKETKEQNIKKEPKPYSLRNPLDVNAQQNVSQISKVDKGTPLKDTSINIAKEEKSETNKLIVGRELGPFSLRKTLEVNAHDVKGEKQAHIAIDDDLPISQSTGLLEVRAAAIEENNSSEQVHVIMEHKKDNMSRQDISLKEIVVTSEPETATVSGRALDDPAQKEYSPTEPHTSGDADMLITTHNSEQFEFLDVKSASKWVEKPIHGQKGLSEEVAVTSEADVATISGRNPDDSLNKEHTYVMHHAQQGSSQNMLDESENSSTCGTSLKKRKSLEYLGVEQFHRQDMESWILPDERKRVCITTGGKKMMDFAGCFDTRSERNQMDINSFRGEVGTKVAMDSETLNEGNDTETASCDLMESKLERPTNDGFFGGPIGQAVRIAIMVAFGTLVVVARQSRNR
ncbi:hypothetical protein ACHQM5_001835 [Ranunculus cassubicifolius]